MALQTSKTAIRGGAYPMLNRLCRLGPPI